MSEGYKFEMGEKVIHSNDMIAWTVVERWIGSDNFRYYAADGRPGSFYEGALEGYSDLKSAVESLEDQIKFIRRKMAVLRPEAVQTGAMTEDRLEEIQAREQAATEGPWRLRYNLTSVWSKVTKMICVAIFHPDHVPGGKYNKKTSQEQAQNNAEFISHAREDIPDLVSEIRRLWASNAKLIKTGESVLRTIQEVHDGRAGGVDLINDGIQLRDAITSAKEGK